MATCKNCGSGFHACGSCGITTQWEWDYCSETCHYEAIRKTKNELAAKHNIGIEILDDIVDTLQSNGLMEY